MKEIKRLEVILSDMRAKDPPLAVNAGRYETMKAKLQHSGPALIDANKTRLFLPR